MSSRRRSLPVPVKVADAFQTIVLESATLRQFLQQPEHEKARRLLSDAMVALAVVLLHPDEVFREAPEGNNQSVPREGVTHE